MILSLATTVAILASFYFESANGAYASASSSSCRGLDKVLMLRGGALKRSSCGGLDKLIILRGGELKRYVDPNFTKIEMIDRTSSAGSLINNIKIPAALLFGQSLGAAFAKLDAKDGSLPPKSIELAYRILTFLALFSELVALFSATILNWRILAGGFDTTARSAPALLMKYFDYEYLSMIVSFLGGMISLVLANAIRTLVHFGAEHKISLFLVGINLFLGAYFVHLFDCTVISFDNGLVGLLPHLARRTMDVLVPLFTRLSFWLYVIISGATIYTVRELMLYHAAVEKQHAAKKR